MKNLKKFDGIKVANCGNWSIWLNIVEKPNTGWGLGLTPYYAFLTKEQSGGYDNGPWPRDDGKKVPLMHVYSVMEHEGINFSDAVKTQFTGVKTVMVTINKNQILAAATADLEDRRAAFIKKIQDAVCTSDGLLEMEAKLS